MSIEACFSYGFGARGYLVLDRRRGHGRREIGTRRRQLRYIRTYLGIRTVISLARTMGTTTTVYTYTELVPNSSTDSSEATVDLPKLLVILGH